MVRVRSKGYQNPPPYTTTIPPFQLRVYPFPQALSFYILIVTIVYLFTAIFNRHCILHGKRGSRCIKDILVVITRGSRVTHRVRWAPAATTILKIIRKAVVDVHHLGGVPYFLDHRSVRTLASEVLVQSLVSRSYSTWGSLRHSYRLFQS